MKVCLTAFNQKLSSDFLDWPEKTGPDIYMIMDMEIPPIPLSYEKIEAIPMAKRKARFQSTGRYFVRGGESAQEYKLVEVS